MHPPGTGQWQLPDTAFCRLLAEFFTWVTDAATAAAAVAGGWPFADVITVCRPDSALSSAVVCDENADFASVANVLASAWMLLSAVGREPRPFVATSTLPKFWTEILSWLASVQYAGVLLHPAASPDKARTRTTAGSSAHLRRACPMQWSHVSSSVTETIEDSPETIDTPYFLPRLSRASGPVSSRYLSPRAESLPIRRRLALRQGIRHHLPDRFT